MTTLADLDSLNSLVRSFVMSSPRSDCAFLPGVVLRKTCRRYRKVGLKRHCGIASQTFKYKSRNIVIILEP